MTTGWAEFLRWIGNRLRQDQRAPAATWSTFEQIAAGSEQSQILQIIRRCGALLPEQERYQLAIAIARLMAPVEWPRELVAARSTLAVALDALVYETGPNNQGSFFSFESEVHEPNCDVPQVLQTAHVLFWAARDFFRKPCRRDEIPTVALLCNSAYATTLRIYRRSNKIEIIAARRMRNAMVAYATAANAVNAAAGSVLFEGLHAPIEEAF